MIGTLAGLQLRLSIAYNIDAIALFPQQQRLLPDAPQDGLQEGHPAYFISDSLDSLDLSAFHARYAKGGPRNQPFHLA